MKFQINNQDWHVKVLSDYSYNKYIGRDSIGITCYDLDSDAEGARTILFNRKHMTREVILHELMHAYLAYQPTRKKMRRETFEEIFCEFFEKHFDAISDQATAIQRYFF